MDITERRLADETLRATKTLLEFTLNSAQIGDWDLDLLNDTSTRSLRHDQCFGYSTAVPEAEWGAEVFIRHVHPLDREHLTAVMHDAVSELHGWSEEFRVVWSDGSVHWLAASGSIYRTFEGRATRMIGIVSDITARKSAEEALAASEQMARSQVEALCQTLDALQLDETPDRLAHHLSRTVTLQLGAHSNSVWRRDEDSGQIVFEFAFEANRFIGKNDPALAGIDTGLPMDDSLPWPIALRAGKHCLVEDIRTVPAFQLRDRLIKMGIVTVLMIPMLIAGRLDGVIAIRYAHKRVFRCDEIEFAKTLANQAVLAMRVTRLSSERRDLAVIAERNRMARDIHDTLAQGFTGVIVQLEAADDARLRGLLSETGEHIERASQLARESLSEARRSVRALRPKALEENDLGVALDGLLTRVTGGTGLTPVFKALGAPRPLSPMWEGDLLRIAQEALTNALRHAHADRLAATLEFTPEAVHLTLTDNGRGFDQALKHDGFGLMGMRERAQRMGGELLIRSDIGRGTTVAVAVPFSGSLQESVQ